MVAGFAEGTLSKGLGPDVAAVGAKPSKPEMRRGACAGCGSASGLSSGSATGVLDAVAGKADAVDVGGVADDTAVGSWTAKADTAAEASGGGEQDGGRNAEMGKTSVLKEREVVPAE